MSVCVYVWFCICVCVYVWLHLCNICVPIFMFVRTSPPFLSQILGLFYIECVCFEHANLNVCLCFPFRLPLEIFACLWEAVKLQTERLLYTNSNTHTHTHLLSPSTIHTHIHTPLFGHTQKWFSHNFSYLHLVCVLYPPCSISFITQTRTHTRS